MKRTESPPARRRGDQGARPCVSLQQVGVVAGALLMGAGATLALCLGSQFLGTSVPVAVVTSCGAMLGLMSAAPVRPWIERVSAGRSGPVSLVAACVCFAVILAGLGLSALVVAAGTSAATYGLMVHPTRRRLVEGCTAVTLTSAAALVAQGLGWVDGLLPTGTAVLIAAALVVLTAPTLTYVLDLSARASRAMLALEAERRAYLVAVEHAAHHDPLTGLLDRRGLSGPLHRAVASAGPGSLVAVLFMDLDGFKPVNDIHGHAAGDELLVQVAARIVGCLREGDVVARTGGDEFVVVLQGLPDAGAAHDVAGRLGVELGRAFMVGRNTSVAVGASIGVSTASMAVDPDELMSRADAAMYRIKQGRGVPSPWAARTAVGAADAPTAGATAGAAAES